MEMKRSKRMLFRLPGSARTAKPGSLPKVRDRGVARQAEALGSGPLPVTSSPAPPPRLPLPAAWRCAVAHRAGGWSHRWVPLFLGGWESLGLWPSAGRPLRRRRREGDNCPETQHLSGPVVQGAREGWLRAAALTPQRPGMRAGPRGGRGSQGAPPGVPTGDNAPLLGKGPPRSLLGMGKAWVPNPVLPPAMVCDLGCHFASGPQAPLCTRSKITASPCGFEAQK